MAGFMLVPHGHSNLVIMIVLFLLWRPGQVIFVLLGVTEGEKNPQNISIPKGSVLLCCPWTYCIKGEILCTVMTFFI